MGGDEPLISFSHRDLIAKLCRLSQFATPDGSRIRVRHGHEPSGNAPNPGEPLGGLVEHALCVLKLPRQAVDPGAADVSPCAHRASRVAEHLSCFPHGLGRQLLDLCRLLVCDISPAPISTLCTVVRLAVAL